MKWLYLRFFVLFIAVGFVSFCSQKDVALEGDISDVPNVDGIMDQLGEEDTADVGDSESEPWLPCGGEPWSECWADYTACTAQKPFCCIIGDSDIGIECCCEDSECGGRFPVIQRCYETPLSSIVMDCAGDSLNCPAVKPYCCRSTGSWGGLYVCADHALLNWTCDEPSEP